MGLTDTGGSSGGAAVPAGPQEVTITNDSFSIKDITVIQPTKTKVSRNKFLIDIASDIFYSRDLQSNTVKNSARDAIRYASVFYDELIKAKLISENKKQGTVEY